jgi:hypothetical protein
MSELCCIPFRSAFLQYGPALPNGWLYFYLAGTDTPASIYEDPSLTVALPNPVIADAAGQFAMPIYLNATVDYRVLVKDSAEVQVLDLDPYASMQPPQTLDPRDFGARGGYATLTEARNGIDDTTAIQALLVAWSANPTLVPNFGGRYWKISQTIRFEQSLEHQAAYFIAGMFVAAGDSAGDNLIEISLPYGGWQGKLGAYGNDSSDYAGRNWLNGIFIDNSYRLRAPMGWVAESFKRDGMAVYAPNGTENNIAIMIGPGRAENCGSVLGWRRMLLAQEYSAVTSDTEFGSTQQRSVLTMTADVPSEIAIDDICYHALTPHVESHTGDGANTVFYVGDVYRWHSTFSKASAPSGAVLPKIKRSVQPNSVEFVSAPAIGVLFEITTTPYEPFVVTEINGAELSIYPHLPANLTTSTLVYGHGAGLRVVGANTASCHFGLVEGFRCGSLIHAAGLYAGKFDGVQSQASGCAMSLGHPADGSYGGQLGYFHSESTAYDIISMSTPALRMDLPAPSAMGTQTSGATGELFGQVFQIAPRFADGTYRPAYSALNGLTLRGVHSPIPMRSGPTRGVALETVSLSNYPHENFVAQKVIDETPIRLKWYDVLDEKMRGYNHCAAFLCGLSANNGPATPTIVTIDTRDNHVTVNGGTELTIPASNYPLHIVAVMDNADPAAKNWLVSWRSMRPVGNKFLTAELVTTPPNILSLQSWSQVVAVPGAMLGDYVAVSFDLSLQGMMLSGHVSGVDEVTLVLFNPTAVAIALANGTFSVVARATN